MKSMVEKQVYMKYPEPFVRFQENTRSVNMPYLHFHEGYEIYIMIKGKVDYLLPDDAYTLEDATFILINPYVIHKKNAMADMYTTFLINFPPTILKKYFTPDAVQDILSPFGTIPYGRLDAASLKSIVNIAKKTASTKDEATIAIAIAEVLDIISKGSPMKSTHPSTQDCLDKTVYEYVANNLGKKITLDTLSADLFMSKQALTSAFRKTLGTSPMYFVNHVKMNFAHSMLLYPEFSIDAIGKYCGFKSMSYFSKLFKQIFGITPSQCRKNALKSCEDEKIK